jgi:hypothetical protein
MCVMSRYRHFATVGIIAAAAIGSSAAAVGYAFTGPAPAKAAVVKAAPAVAKAAGAKAAGAKAASAAAAPATLDQEYIARNGFGTEVLAVQLQVGVRDTGAFQFTVEKVGTWEGVIPVRQSGSRISHLNGTVSATFETVGAVTTAAATVRMIAVIDRAHNTAVVHVWATRPGQHGKRFFYLLKTSKPDFPQAPRTALSASAAMRSENWPAVYRMAASDVTQNLSSKQFVKLMLSQHQPRPLRLRFTGKGSTSVVAGITYFVQPFRFVTISKDGATIAHTSNILLTWERFAWRFVGTTQPQPSS